MVVITLTPDDGGPEAVLDLDSGSDSSPRSSTNSDSNNDDSDPETLNFSNLTLDDNADKVYESLPRLDECLPAKIEQTYSRLLKKGAIWQEWLSDPRAACNIPRAKLTVEFDGKAQVTASSYPNRLPEEDELKVLKRHGLPINANLFRHHTIGGSFASRSGQQATVFWDGYTAPGMVMIKLISRENPELIPDVPYMADLTYAACQKANILKSLKHIYFVLIVNDDTLAVFRKLYSKMSRSKKCQGEHHWEAGTPEYQALLGTPLGSLVATFVLASFNRGTRRVSRLVTWYEGACQLEWMRADIEAV